MVLKFLLLSSFVVCLPLRALIRFVFSARCFLFFYFVFFAVLSRAKQLRLLVLTLDYLVFLHSFVSSPAALSRFFVGEFQFVCVSLRSLFARHLL